MNNKMRKAFAAVAVMMTMTTMGATLAITSSAQEVTPSSYSQAMVETFDKSKDPDAPNVDKEAFEKGVYKKSEVDQYAFKEGKYYVLRIHRTKVNSFGYTRTNYEHHLVKVEKVYEDPTFFGLCSERTIKVRFCDTGETKEVQPNKFFAVNYPMFEIDDCIIG